MDESLEKSAMRKIYIRLLPFLLLGFLLAAALSYGLSVATLRLCLRYNLLDKPGPRRVHTRPTPRLGGVAIFLAFLTVSLLFFRPANADELRIYSGLLAAALLVVIVMAYDDVRGLPPPTFTVRIMEPGLDESVESGLVSRHLGAEPVAGEKYDHRYHEASS